MVNYCGSLLDYVNRYNTANEVIGLDGHLSVCQNCRDNIGFYCEAFKMIQQDFAVRDVPGSLKKEILNFVFDRETE